MVKKIIAYHDSQKTDLNVCQSLDMIGFVENVSIGRDRA